MDIRTKLADIVSDGAPLRKLDINRWVAHDIAKDFHHLQNGSTKNAFEANFYKFVATFLPIYGDTTDEQKARLKVVLAGAMAISKKPQDFVDGCMLAEYKKSKLSETYQALFESAFVYAAAATYWSQIRRIYMRATNSPAAPTESQKIADMLNGTVNGKYLHGSIEDAAKHSDAEYIAYMDKTHPLLSTFVRTQHRFMYKQILSVMCYITNPDLEKEY